MVLAAETATPRTRGRLFSGWAFGPGLVFFLASFGPQDLLSNSVAGASYGYSLLWTLILIVAARYFILEASARYVLVTGESIFAGYRRCGRWVVWLIMVSALARQHLAGLYYLLLLGGALEMLFPLRLSWSLTLWAVASWVLGFGLMYWGRYRMVEKWAKPLLVLLGASLAGAAFLAKPDPLAVVRGAFVPSIPPEEGVYGFALILMSLAGSGASSLGNLKYAVYVHEKGWRDLSFLKKQRADLLLSVTGLFAMMALMQIAAAGTLRPLGAPLKSVDDLVPMFAVAAGDAGRVVLALGLWAAVFTSYVGVNTGYSLLVSNIFHNHIQSGKRSTAAGEGSDGERPAYRWSLIWFSASPLYVLLTDWKPVWLALFASCVFVVLLPVVVLVLLRLTNDRKLMGDHVNGWATNAVMVFVALAAFHLTWQNGVKLWAELAARF